MEAKGETNSVYGGVTVQECEKMIQKSLRTPMVKFLMDNLKKSGCAIGDNFIKAEKCDKQVSGGYTQGEGIVVCSNHMNIQDEVNQVVIHELIHAYDDCTAKNLDWADCAHHACSEIRAGHLSGDCHFKRELLRGYMKMRGHEQECVKRRAVKSVTGNPYCSGIAAKEAVEAVWDTCYNVSHLLQQHTVINSKISEKERRKRERRRRRTEKREKEKNREEREEE